jgi:Cytochrome b5-like Heme/Steroid binding domain
MQLLCYMVHLKVEICANERAWPCFTISMVLAQPQVNEKWRCPTPAIPTFPQVPARYTTPHQLTLRRIAAPERVLVPASEPHEPLEVPTAPTEEPVAQAEPPAPVPAGGDPWEDDKWTRYKWTVYRGVAYDLTSFIERHPAGSWLINLAIGRDCTGESVSGRGRQGLSTPQTGQACHTLYFVCLAG